MDLTNSSALSRLPGSDAHGVHTQDCFQNKFNKMCLGDFFLLQTARFHPWGFLWRVSEEDNVTCRQKQDNIPGLKMGVQLHCKLVGVVETGQKNELSSHHYSMLSTQSPAVLRTASPHSRHHTCFAGGHFAYTESWAAVIAVIQGNFSPGQTTWTLYREFQAFADYSQI